MEGDPLNTQMSNSSLYEEDDRNILLEEDNRADNNLYPPAPPPYKKDEQRVEPKTRINLSNDIAQPSITTSTVKTTQVTTTTTRLVPLNVDDRFLSKSKAFGCCRQVQGIVWLLTGGMVISVFYWILSFFFMFTCFGLPIAFDLIKMQKIVQLYGNQKSKNLFLRKKPLGEGKLRAHRVKCVLFFPFALILTILHIAFGVLNFALIVFIPLGLRHFKLASITIHGPFDIEMFKLLDVEESTPLHPTESHNNTVHYI